MARQIIILETRPNAGGMTQVQAAFWFAIAALGARVPRNPVASPVPTITPTELTDLESGAVLEEIQVVIYASGMTPAQIKADLVNRYLARGTYLATVPPARQFFGIFYDGSVWNA